MIRIETPAANQPERAFALDTILSEWFGLQTTIAPTEGARTTTIRLADEPGAVEVEESVLLLDHLDQVGTVEAPGPRWVEVGPRLSGAADLQAVPCPYGDCPQWATTVDDDKVTVHVDVLGTSFSLLGGLDESTVTDFDTHGRIPLAETLVGRHDLRHRPTVDELAELLWKAMSTMWPRLRRSEREGGIRPTHDIDRLYKYGHGLRDLPLAVASGFRRDGLSSGFRSMVESIGVRAGRRCDPYLTLDRIMDLAEEAGRISAFYFITRYQPADGTALSRYSMVDPTALELLGRIRGRGHEIGVHAGYRSFRDPEALRADKSTLAEAAERAGVQVGAPGGRHHYLRWDPAHSPRSWEQAGLVYNSSVGFAERPGFRTGTSRPYKLWDLTNRRPTTVEERPLIWMDASIDQPFTEAAVAEEAIQLRDSCLRFGGDFTFLVHNDELTAPGGEDLFKTLLAAP